MRYCRRENALFLSEHLILNQTQQTVHKPCSCLWISFSSRLQSIFRWINLHHLHHTSWLVHLPAGTFYCLPQKKYLLALEVKLVVQVRTCSSALGNLKSLCRKHSFTFLDKVNYLKYKLSRTYSAKVTEKRATKNEQLVLQHWSKTGWITMLRVIPLTWNLSFNKSGC